jgi:hypothetical protein
MNNKIFISITLITAIYLIRLGSKEKTDDIISISIKMRYLGTGIMLLIIAIILIIKEFY